MGTPGLILFGMVFFFGVANGYVIGWLSATARGNRQWASVVDAAREGRQAEADTAAAQAAARRQSELAVAEAEVARLRSLVDAQAATPAEEGEPTDEAECPATVTPRCRTLQ